VAARPKGCTRNGPGTGSPATRVDQFYASQRLPFCRSRTSFQTLNRDAAIAMG